MRVLSHKDIEGDVRMKKSEKSKYRAILSGSFNFVITADEVYDRNAAEIMARNLFVPINSYQIMSLYSFELGGIWAEEVE